MDNHSEFSIYLRFIHLCEGKQYVLWALACLCSKPLTPNGATSFEYGYRHLDMLSMRSQLPFSHLHSNLPHRLTCVAKAEPESGLREDSRILNRHDDTAAGLHSAPADSAVPQGFGSCSTGLDSARLRSSARLHSSARLGSARLRSSARLSAAPLGRAVRTPCLGDPVQRAAAVPSSAAAPPPRRPAANGIRQYLLSVGSA